MWNRKFTIGSIPLQAVAKDDSTERGVVLFYHGLHSSKDTHRQELDSLAARGFLALGVDAVGHGERASGELSAFLDRGEFLPQIYKLLLATLGELPYLVDSLRMKGYSRFALVGISFGALLAYAAPLVEPSLLGIVPILGTPDWGDRVYSPARNLEAYATVPIFAWNAGEDVSSTYASSSIVTRMDHTCIESFPTPATS
jgi:alpha-beta hydrolase superfamily lysophospholipase